MYILGIDPGVQNIGLAIYSTLDDSVLAHEKYIWQNSYEKLRVYIRDLLPIVKAVSIEKPFFSQSTLAKNIRTLEVIGVIKLAIEQYNLDLKHESVQWFEYAPTTIKKTFTGNGKAKKTDIITVVKEKYSISTNITHVADAIAIAYTHHVKCTELHNR